MTDTPPYLISYDFGQNWIPVPQDLWPYFGAVDDCSQILDGMLAFPNTQASMTDGTNMFGALFIELRNPDNVAIWLNQGYVTSPTGSFLEFAGGLFDRQTNPNVFIDDTNPNGTVLTPAPCVEGLVQWYWANPAAQMSADGTPKRHKPRVPALERFLRTLRESERRWKRQYE